MSPGLDLFSPSVLNVTLAAWWVAHLEMGFQLREKWSDQWTGTGNLFFIPLMEPTNAFRVVGRWILLRDCAPCCRTRPRTQRAQAHALEQCPWRTSSGSSHEDLLLEFPLVRLCENVILFAGLVSHPSSKGGQNGD